MYPKLYKKKIKIFGCVKTKTQRDKSYSVCLEILRNLHSDSEQTAKLYYW